MYCLDTEGQVVPRASWTDTLNAVDAKVEGDRAFVTCTDEMTFDGGHIPPQSYSMTEGYFLNTDGSLGDYFIETSGQVTRSQLIDQDVWAYTSPASPQELASLGLSDVISAQHVFVKVVTTEGGREAHRITRVTTANWRGSDGQERWQQFVSMQGVHHRQAD